MVARLVLWVGLLATVVNAQGLMNSRTFLEKQLFYVSKGKIGKCKYWSLHMGAHDCTVRRKFPGEDTVSVEATFNFDLISSGYVSGSGYSERGKLDCLTSFYLLQGDSSMKIDIDSIDYAFDYCGKAVLTTGEKGDLRIDGEGTFLRPKKCLLRIFHMVDYYGEKVLRPKTDVKISAFSFSKEGIKRALAAEKKLKAATQ